MQRKKNNQKRDQGIVDIRLTDEFLMDWESVPKNIRDRVDRQVAHILASGRLPNSLNAHRASGVGFNIWIGHINNGRNPYRLLFVVEDGVLVCKRLLTHTEMDLLFKKGIVV